MISQLSRKRLLDLSSRIANLQLINSLPKYILNAKTMTSKKTVPDLGLLFLKMPTKLSGVLVYKTKKIHSMALEKALCSLLVYPIYEMYPFLSKVVRLSDELELEFHLHNIIQGVPLSVVSST